MKLLDEVKKKTENNTNELGIKQKLLSCAKNIADSTSAMINSNDDTNVLKKVMELSRNCANRAKALIGSTEKSYEVRMITINHCSFSNPSKISIHFNSRCFVLNYYCRYSLRLA